MADAAERERLALLRRMQATYDKAAQAYAFVPGAYTFEVMQLLGLLLRDARPLLAPPPKESRPRYRSARLA